MTDTGDGWCLECGDEFHLDDCGGYNPPCPCGCGCCRSCCPERITGDDLGARFRRALLAALLDTLNDGKA